MNVKTTLLTAAAILVFGLDPASASVFTESVQFGPGPTDYNSATGTTAGPGGNQLFYFDTNGGTLNSITFSYAFSVSSQITVTNTSSSASTGNARTQSAPQFGSSASAITAALNSAVNTYADPIDGTSVSFGTITLTPIAADVRGTATSYSLAPGASTSFTSAGIYSRSQYTITDASVLAAFGQPGGGTFTPLFTTLSGLIISNSGGNTTANQTTTAQGNLAISFNYDAATVPPNSVPEPASMMLLGAGVVSAGLLRRRHK